MLHKLDDSEYVRHCIRRRPAMYVGGTDICGMNHLVWELVANSVDQFLARHASSVEVRIEGNWVKVSDDGIGMPFDEKDDSGANLAAAYLTRLHVTASADGHAPHVHCTGLHGVGVVAVNMLSREFSCEAWRNGELWRQEFRQGLATDLPRVIASGDGRGTSVSFCPDEEIFGEMCFRADAVRRNLFEIAHLNPGLKVVFDTEQFHSERGLADYVAAIESEAAHSSDVWDEIFTVTEKFGDVSVNVAAVGVADEIDFRPWVNGVSTLDGSHVNGMRNALGDVGWQPAMAAIHVVMHDPQFAGPTRGQLRAPQVARVLRKGLRPLLEEFCQQHGLGNYANR